MTTRETLAKANENKLSLKKLLLLTYLLDNENTSTPSRLAKELLVSTAAMTGMLDRLTEEKLITKDHGRADRRQILVSATLKGVELTKEVLGETHE